PAHRFRPGADEEDAIFGAGLGKFRAFRKQSITWVDGVRAAELGHPKDLVDRQVAFDRAHVLGQPRPATDLVAFVCLEAVQRVFVLLRPDRHGLDAKLGGSTKDTDRDLGTVRDKNLANGQGATPNARFAGTNE